MGMSQYAQSYTKGLVVHVVLHHLVNVYVYTSIKSCLYVTSNSGYFISNTLTSVIAGNQSKELLFNLPVHVLGHTDPP